MAAKKTKVDPPAAPTTANIPRPRLHRLSVQNFRCIGPTPVEIELDDIVVLVGPNNAGKSSILRAYQVVMEHGSAEGELTLDDFPNGVPDPALPPTIELETVVFERTAPGDQWVRTDPETGEMFVRERWTWIEPGQPKKVGWDVTASAWHDSSGPWGTPNVAQSYRPKPHRVDAFHDPKAQAAEVMSLLSKAISDRVKELGAIKTKEDGTPSDFDRLLASIGQLRRSIASDAATAVEDVRKDLGAMIADVFPGYSVEFDARPDEDVEKALVLYRPSPILKMGPLSGFKTSIDRQGSGASRTLIWSALRVLSERKPAKPSNSHERPHVLLMDEPELCLHPDAIRDACRVLYDLPQAKNWQVVITTHSPVFIDLTRDNTSIARVERRPDGNVYGTTIFRPAKARLDENDRVELKLQNLCDPYFAEFFFGGRTVLVEGDTEYTAFRHIMAASPTKYGNVHVVRARGKACLVSLCKILDQFDKDYAVLHDSDRPKVIGRKTKKLRVNSAWTENAKILTATVASRSSGKARLVSSIVNFEEAFFGEEADGEKPYSALARLQQDHSAFKRIEALLDSLIDWKVSVPAGAIAWSTIAELEAAVASADAAGSSSPAN